MKKTITPLCRMFLPTFHFSLRAGRRALCLLAVVVAFHSRVQAQELSPPQPTQATDLQVPSQSAAIQANGVQDSIQPLNSTDNDSGHVAKYGPLDVQVSAQASAVYNDNVFIQRTDKTSDLILTTTPDASVGTGDYIRKEESWLTVDYKPSFVVFADHSGDDSIDEDALLNMEWRPANWTFGLQQGYQELSGPVVEVGNRVNRNLYNTGIYAKYAFDSKTTLELDGTQSINSYDAPLFGYNVWTLSQWGDYWLTPKIRVGVGSTEGFDDVSHNPNQTFQQTEARAEYDLSELFTFRGSAGTELRQFEHNGHDRLDGIFSFGGTYQPVKGTDFLFDAYRRSENSLIVADQNYMVSGFSVGGSQVFNDNYTVHLTGGFDHADYYGTVQGVTPAGSYNYFFIRPELNWQVTTQFATGIFYQYQESLTSGPNAFNNNVVGVNLDYRF